MNKNFYRCNVIEPRSLHLSGVSVGDDTVYPTHVAPLGAELGRLGTLGNNLSPNYKIPIQDENKHKGLKYDLRLLLNEFSSLKSCRTCGKVPISNVVTIKEKSFNSGKAGFGGLASCSSVWACPVCSAKVASVRKTEIDFAIQKAIDNKYFVSMLTLTQRHHKKQRLIDLWDALSYAWQFVLSGRKASIFKDSIGWVGFIRAVEVTHGNNGWHVHTHILLITKKDPRITIIFSNKGRGKNKFLVAQRSADFIAEHWKTALKKKNIDFVANRGGLDWQVADRKGDMYKIGRYVAKMQTNSRIDGLSKEMSLGAFKKGRKENRTPFQIFEDFAETGDMDDLKLWHIWEKASKGKRALIWSNGLKSWAGIRERSDEDIVEESLDGEAIIAFGRQEWRKIYDIGSYKVLGIYNKYGLKALIAFLEENDIGYLLLSEKQRE